VVLRESHRDDGLADLLVRLQLAVGLDDLLEREGLGDDRLEAAVGEPVVDERLAAFPRYWPRRNIDSARFRPNA
jgi:hypothetical protein